MNISEKKLNFGNNGYQYKIGFSDKLRGEAQLFYEQISNWAGTKVYNTLMNYDLKTENKIVHLNEFYPNGKRGDKKISKHMRKGHGSIMLDYLINKSISNEAKAMIIFTKKTLMQYFLLKHDFERIDKHHFIKILTK